MMNCNDFASFTTNDLMAFLKQRFLWEDELLKPFQGMRCLIIIEINLDWKIRKIHCMDLTELL